ncbi:MAG TPA: CoA ester lyase [Vitreimonas sp.]|uniref:HpcH/HpaI aldolase/citrate lyase family protein n=1 Tax=Vitreimonas sp. TaxID=3069702 RepID=UPI002D21F612|nr:CoA ester lyase [Vitreimonas sp.]HYD86295.1 CoA ester lyase [Vitreimonas sp.]
MTTHLAHRPRRSCLYMPGANTKAMEKAKTLAADVLLLDLEDSVAPDAKETARAQVAAAVKAGGYGKREVIVRVNALSTPWGGEDIAAAGAAGPDGMLAPKVESGEQVRALDRAMSEAGFAPDATLWVMIETPRAILDIAEIAAAAKGTRLSCFVMGLNDLAKETRARPSAGRAAFHAAMSLAVTAARAEGLTAIDGVYNDIADAEGFRAECEQGLAFGFDGKTLIHPSQIEAANAVFAPAEEEVARARGVIEAFALPENAGKGVIKVDGRMTELLHLEEAKRVVAVSEAIAALGS